MIHHIKYITNTYIKYITISFLKKKDKHRHIDNCSPIIGSYDSLHRLPRGWERREKSVRMATEEWKPHSWKNVHKYAWSSTLSTLWEHMSYTFGSLKLAKV